MLEKVSSSGPGMVSTAPPVTSTASAIRVIPPTPTVPVTGNPNKTTSTLINTLSATSIASNNDRQVLSAEKPTIQRQGPVFSPGYFAAVGSSRPTATSHRSLTANTCQRPLGNCLVNPPSTTEDDGSSSTDPFPNFRPRVAGMSTSALKAAAAGFPSALSSNAVASDERVRTLEQKLTSMELTTTMLRAETQAIRTAIGDISEDIRARLLSKSPFVPGQEGHQLEHQRQHQLQQHQQPLPHAYQPPQPHHRIHALGCTINDVYPSQLTSGLYSTQGQAASAGGYKMGTPAEVSLTIAFSWRKGVSCIDTETNHARGLVTGRFERLIKTPRVLTNLSQSSDLGIAYDAKLEATAIRLAMLDGNNTNGSGNTTTTHSHHHQPTSDSTPLKKHVVDYKTAAASALMQGNSGSPYPLGSLNPGLCLSDQTLHHGSAPTPVDRPHRGSLVGSSKLESLSKGLGSRSGSRMTLVSEEHGASLSASTLTANPTPAGTTSTASLHPNVTDVESLERQHQETIAGFEVFKSHSRKMEKKLKSRLDERERSLKQVVIQLKRAEERLAYYESRGMGAGASAPSPRARGEATTGAASSGQASGSVASHSPWTAAVPTQVPHGPAHHTAKSMASIWQDRNRPSSMLSIVTGPCSVILWVR